MFRLLTYIGLTPNMAKMVLSTGHYLVGKWWILLMVGLAGAGWGYWIKKSEKPSYTAGYTFVLSTETRPAGNIAGLVSQFGVDLNGQSGSDGIFTGDNIIELFSSRKIANETLFHTIEGTHQTLANLMLRDLYGADPGKQLSGDPQKFTPAQNKLLKQLQQLLLNSLVVYKKDKRLIYYVFSVNAKNPDIAFYAAKYMLEGTAQYFIETKTRTATRSMVLLQKEADSIAGLLGRKFQETAELTDRSFNINPSIQVQRSGALLNQAKTTALASAYAEVVKNLEIAKINLQKETPLYRIIDEPSLPLEPEFKKSRYFPIFTGVAAVGLIMALFTLLTIIKLNTRKQGQPNG